MVNICASCGRENPGDARFCNGCGGQLAVGPTPREHRKTVTVLFCDVTGSTAMGERLDPESLRQVMRRYFDSARAVIEQHGGTVEKFIGDAVMAIFGVPVLHEDDALRAVRAAAGLRDALAELNVELERDYGTSVTVRTGVNTGQVVTGTEERLATGDAVNVAARLEQAAAPGEIVIGPETWRLVRDAVTVEPMAPLELKGKSQPVSAYRLIRLGSDGPAPPTRVETPMVGRATPLRMLRDAFANVIDGRSCSLFTVLGAAGVGKSRLTAEFLRDIDATVLRGRCLSYGEGITYWPVITIVKHLLESPNGDEPAALMARDPKVAAPIQAIIGEHAAAATSSTEIAWAVRKLLESAADARPLVVVFDDVHWGEPTLFDLIEHIGDLSRGVPILLLCLGRPELLDRRPGWGGGKLNAATVLLEPLNAAETESLIDELLPDGGTFDADLRARVRTTAAGNPLFVEEIVAMLRESSSHDVIVPPTIKALLAARFDQLRPEERDVLERGSVEGQSFHRGAIEVMAPGEHDVAGRLMTLVRKDLLRPDRAVFAGEDAFAFRHLLIRDAAYDSLPKAARAGMHVRFADWLLDRGADLEELDEIVGYHLEQAARYRAELGPADESTRRVAAAAGEHLDAAGGRALDRGDATAAVNFLDRAASLMPSRELNIALEVSLIQGLGMCGRMNDAITRAQALVAACAARGDVVGELRAQLIGTVWRQSVDPVIDGELRLLVDRARPIIEHSGDKAALASLEYAAGWLEHYRVHFGAAFTSLTRAMQYAAEINEVWFVRNVREVAAAVVASGPMPLDQALQWLEAAPVDGSGYHPFIGTWRAWLLSLRGDFDEARSLFATTLEEVAERGMTTLLAIAMQVGWEIEATAGDLLASERAARQGCEQLEQMGERGWLSTQACQLGAALYSLGRYEEAEHWAQRGLELGGKGDIYTLMVGSQVRAKLLAQSGNVDAAFELARYADELARGTEAPMQQGDAAMTLAEVLHRAGNTASAAPVVLRAVRIYTAKGATASVANAQRTAETWGIHVPTPARVHGPA